MPITKSSALYYPYIEVRDEHWLRSAVLFWDSIRTIVPGSYPDPYSNNFARELRKAGVLIPIPVSQDMEEIESLTDLALDFLTDPVSAGVLGDIENHSKRRIHPDKLSYEVMELANINPEKVPYIIQEHLGRALNKDGMLPVSSGFANFYMTLLATKMAERLGLGLVTESSNADQLAIAVKKGKPLGSFGDGRLHRRHMNRMPEALGPRRSLPPAVAPGLLFDLIVQGITLPEHLSVNEVLRFKEDHREELALFRREVTRLTGDLPEEISVEALRQWISDQYESNVIPAMNSLKRSLKAQHWDNTLSTFLKVSSFSIPSTSVAILAGLPSPMAIFAGAGISLTMSAVMMINQRNQTIRESPYSYLLSLNRKQ